MKDDLKMISGHTQFFFLGPRVDWKTGNLLRSRLGIGRAQGSSSKALFTWL